MKVYMSKGALTKERKGMVRELEVRPCNHPGVYSPAEGRIEALVMGKDIHLTLEEAIKAREKDRFRRVGQLKRRLQELNEMGPPL